MTTEAKIWLGAIGLVVAQGAALIGELFSSDTMNLLDLHSYYSWSQWLPVFFGILWACMLVICLFKEKNLVRWLCLVICIPHCMFYWFICLVGSASSLSPLVMYTVYSALMLALVVLCFTIALVVVYALEKPQPSHEPSQT